MQLLLDGTTRIDEAIERIRYFEPPEGYWLAFSGGKDSCVLRWLADQAGVKYDAHYNITTCDPPELVRFIRKNHHDVICERPPFSMWQGIVRHGYPTRAIRWCCRYFKEAGGKGRQVLTGVRWEESSRRKKLHGLVTHWTRPQKQLINPIVDWPVSDVWGCIRENHIPYCELYDEGWKRLGCVLCPMVHATTRQSERWPRIAARWRKAFQKLWEIAPSHRKPCLRDLQEKWSSGDALFEAWLDRDRCLSEEEPECELFAGAGVE